MSYLMVMRIKADPAELERVANEDAETMRDISQRGKEAGAIHHAFFGGEGEAFVVDEWDDPANFQKFFEAEAGRIGPLMQSAGAQGEPEISFYKKLDTSDAF